MTPINWPDGWTPHADRDASEPSMRERAERAESVARGQQRLIEAQRVEVERLQATLDGLRQLRVEDYAALAETSDERNDAEAEVARLLAEIADRESERADLRDRVEKAEAAVGRVEAALDIRTRARAWMNHLGYEDHQIDKAEAWRQPHDPWLQDDPPRAVVDLETAAGFAREYEEAIRAALRGDQ